MSIQKHTQTSRFFLYIICLQMNYTIHIYICNVPLHSGPCSLINPFPCFFYFYFILFFVRVVQFPFKTSH